jgi:hypothetical protein
LNITRRSGHGALTRLSKQAFLAACNHRVVHLVRHLGVSCDPTQVVRRSLDVRVSPHEHRCAGRNLTVERVKVARGAFRSLAVSTSAHLGCAVRADLATAAAAAAAATTTTTTTTTTFAPLFMAHRLFFVVVAIALIVGWEAIIHSDPRRALGSPRACGSIRTEDHGAHLVRSNISSQQHIACPIACLRQSDPTLDPARTT